MANSSYILPPPPRQTSILREPPSLTRRFEAPQEAVPDYPPPPSSVPDYPPGNNSWMPWTPTPEPPPTPVRETRGYLPPNIWDAAAQARMQWKQRGIDVDNTRDAWATMMADLPVPGNINVPDFWALVWDNVISSGEPRDELALENAYLKAYDQYAYPGPQADPSSKWTYFGYDQNAPGFMLGNFWDPYSGRMGERQLLARPWEPPPSLWQNAPSDLTGWVFRDGQWVGPDQQNQQLFAGQQTAAQQQVPLPWQLSPIVWNSMGPVGQGLLKGAAEAQGWDWNDYQTKMQAAWPVGTAPSRVLTTYGNLRRY